MTKKVFGSKQITHLIYGILMLLPFLSILSTCAYVSLNKNAYQSYSASEIQEVVNVYYDSNEVNSASDLQNNCVYTFINDGSGRYDTFFSIKIGDYWLRNGTLTSGTIQPLYTTPYICRADSSVSSIQLIISSTEQYTTSVSFEIDFIFIQNNNNIGNAWQYIHKCDRQYIRTTEIITETQTLDNTFDYSISKFVQDNDNYNIHFFDWFGNLFLKNGNTGVNAIYLNFINWYLNYALLVSVGYILFLLMLWFINFVRKILEGGNSFGHGGF